MKSNGCMNRENLPMQMTASDLFVFNSGQKMRNFLLLGVLALSFLFGGQVKAQTL